MPNPAPVSRATHGPQVDKSVSAPATDRSTIEAVIESTPRRHQGGVCTVAKVYAALPPVDGAKLRELMDARHGESYAYPADWLAHVATQTARLEKVDLILTRASIDRHRRGDCQCERP